MTTYAYLENRNDTVEVAIEGYVGEGDFNGVLSINLETGTITRVSTGDTLSFATDREGYIDRPTAHEVPSENDEDKVYLVYKFSADPRTWVCNCPDFEHRRRSEARTCKHIGWLRGYGYKQIDANGVPVRR